MLGRHSSAEFFRGSGQATALGEGGVISDGGQVQQSLPFGGNGIDESFNLQISAFADVAPVELQEGGYLQAFES